MLARIYGWFTGRAKELATRQPFYPQLMRPDHHQPKKEQESGKLILNCPTDRLIGKIRH
jgi:hypothetical protein